jgi:hypothetical protein
MLHFYLQQPGIIKMFLLCNIPGKVLLFFLYKQDIMRVNCKQNLTKYYILLRNVASVLKSLQWYSGRKRWKSEEKNCENCSPIRRRVDLCFREIILCFEMNKIKEIRVIPVISTSKLALSHLSHNCSWRKSHR